MIKRIYLSIIFAIIIHAQLYSQLNFTIDTIYLDTVEFIKISSNSIDIWTIGVNPEQRVYRLSNNYLIDMSSELSEVIDNELTDIVNLDINEIIIGTDQNYAYHYKNGILTNMNSQFGLSEKDKHINTLFFDKTADVEYGDTLSSWSYFGLTTPNGFYRAPRYNQSYTHLFQDMEANILSDNYAVYSYVSDGKVYISCNSAGTLYTFGYFYEDTDGEIICANVKKRSWNNTVSHKYVGTSKGLIVNPPIGERRYLDSIRVNSIHTYGGYNLIGTDSGLYCIGTTEEPTKLNIDDLDFKVNDILNHNGCLYLATDIGLIKLRNTECDDYLVGHGQNLKYMNLADNDTLRLEPNCNNCSDDFVWNFGDGNLSNKTFPSYQYNEPGFYEIKLIASNGYCIDSSTSFISVYKDSIVNRNTFTQNTSFPFNSLSSDYAAISVIDSDNDSDVDVFIPSEGLFENINTTNLEFTKSEFEYTNNGTVIWGDLNNDGLNEMVSKNYIFINKGENQFTMMNYFNSYLYGMVGPKELIDFDNDGLLDIIQGTYGDLNLFKNCGNFEFAHIDNVFDNHDEIRMFSWVDIDNNGENELYVLRDQTNILYVKENGVYKRNTSSTLTEINGYICSWGDINNDKLIDLFLGEHVYINKGNFEFELLEDTWASIAQTPLIPLYANANSSAFADIDNNSFIDLIKNEDFEYNRVYLNLGEEIFVNDTSNIFTKQKMTRDESVIITDIDNNGYIDLIDAGTDNYSSEATNKLFINNDTLFNWVKFNCIGTKSNFNAVGANIQIKCNIEGKDIWQTRQISSSTGWNAQSDYSVHFGVRDSEIIDTLKIIWPSGYISEYSNLSVNNVYDIVEPYIRYFGDTLTCENVPVYFSMPLKSGLSYRWFKDDIEYSPLNSNFFRVVEEGNYWCIITNNEFGVDTTSQMSITFKPVNNVNIEFENNDSNFCSFDSVLINATMYTGGVYSWFKGDTIVQNHNTNFLYCNDSSPIHLIYTNEHSCSDTSEYLYPNVMPLPYVKLPNDTIICEGDSITIIPISDIGKTIWNTGDTTASITVYGAGNYVLNVMNEFGCKNEDDFNLSIQPLPYVDLGKDTTIEYFDELLLNWNYNSFYDYFWNDDYWGEYRYITGSDFGFGDHTFTLVAYDYLGCFSSDSITISIILNNDTVKNNTEVILFPNPAKDKFRIYLDSKYWDTNTSIDIYNSNSKIIKNYKFNLPNPDLFYIDLSGFSSGAYFIRIKNKNIDKVARIIIIK